MMPNKRLNRRQNLPRKSRHLNRTSQEVSHGTTRASKGGPLQREVQGNRGEGEFAALGRRLRIEVGVPGDGEEGR